MAATRAGVTAHGDRTRRTGRLIRLERVPCRDERSDTPDTKITGENPWTQGLWVLAIGGIVLGAFLMFVAAIVDGLAGLVLATLGNAVATAGPIALVAVIVLGAIGWDREHRRR